jgi:hypothetical protein
MGCYAQLTQEERYQIMGLLKAGYNLSEIARETGRHRSTISREIGRNSGKRGYRPAQAHELASDVNIGLKFPNFSGLKFPTLHLTCPPFQSPIGQLSFSP